MRLIFEQQPQRKNNYINKSLANPLHSINGGCVKRKASTLTLVNTLYLKSLGYNVRTATAVSRPQLR